MKIKDQLIKTLCMLPILAGGSVYAQSAGSHGGGAWVCKRQNIIQWVKLADLFEIKNRWPDLTLDPIYGNSIGANLQSIETKIAEMNEDVLAEYKTEIKKIRQTTGSSEISIIRVPDADFVIKPSEDLCQNGTIDFEQIANYLDDGTILLAKKILDKLSPLEKSALYVHEAVYKVIRSNRHGVRIVVKEADLARQAVANLFSTKKVADYAFEFLGESQQKVFEQYRLHIEGALAWKVLDTAFPTMDTAVYKAYLDPVTGILKRTKHGQISSVGGISIIDETLIQTCHKDGIYSYTIHCDEAKPAFQVSGAALNESYARTFNEAIAKKADVVLADARNTHHLSIQIYADSGYQVWESIEQ